MCRVERMPSESQVCASARFSIGDGQGRVNQHFFALTRLQSFGSNVVLSHTRRCLMPVDARMDPTVTRTLMALSPVARGLDGRVLGETGLNT